MGPLETGDPARPGIVHRLDKFTSGVMLVAKTKAAHRQLSQQFKNREVKKEYTAVVHGIPSLTGAGPSTCHWAEILEIAQKSRSGHAKKERQSHTTTSKMRTAQCLC